MSFPIPRDTAKMREFSRRVAAVPRGRGKGGLEREMAAIDAIRNEMGITDADYHWPVAFPHGIKPRDIR